MRYAYLKSNWIQIVALLFFVCGAGVMLLDAGAFPQTETQPSATRAAPQDANIAATKPATADSDAALAICPIVYPVDETPSTQDISMRFTATRFLSIATGTCLPRRMFCIRFATEASLISWCSEPMRRRR